MKVGEVIILPAGQRKKHSKDRPRPWVDKRSDKISLILSLYLISYLISEYARMLGGRGAANSATNRLAGNFIHSFVDGAS